MYGDMTYGEFINFLRNLAREGKAIPSLATEDVYLSLSDILRIASERFTDLNLRELVREIDHDDMENRISKRLRLINKE